MILKKIEFGINFIPLDLMTSTFKQPFLRF